MECQKKPKKNDKESQAGEREGIMTETDQEGAVASGEECSWFKAVWVKEFSGAGR